MGKKIFAIFIIFILLPLKVLALENKTIEIFDISLGKVVKIVQPNPKIQKLAVKYIANNKGIYTKFSPVPDKGFAVKIPLSPIVKIQDNYINSYIDEIIIMFPEDNDPFLMFFDEKDKLICYSFKGNTKQLLKHLNYVPETIH